MKVKTKVHKYRRNDGTPVRTHTRKIDVDVFKPEKPDNTFENKDDSPSLEVDKELVQKSVKKIEQPKRLSYDDVKAPEKEGDKPRMPGKISGGTEFNGAVDYILRDHKNVMELKVNSSEIKGGNLSGVDVSKQKEEITGKQF